MMIQAILKNLKFAIFGILLFSCDRSGTNSIPTIEPITDTSDTLQVKDSFSNSFEYLLDLFPIAKLPFELNTNRAAWADSSFNRDHNRDIVFLPAPLKQKWFSRSVFKNNNTNKFLTSIEAPLLNNPIKPSTIKNLQIGFRIKKNSIDYLVCYSLQTFSATNGGINTIWLAKFDENHNLISFEDLGLQGSYWTNSYTEDDEASYFEEQMWSSSSVINFREDLIKSTTQNKYHQIKSKTSFQSEKEIQDSTTTPHTPTNVTIKY